MGGSAGVRGCMEWCLPFGERFDQKAKHILDLIFDYPLEWLGRILRPREEKVFLRENLDQSERE